MKKILLTLMIFASAGLMAKLSAQCTLSNLVVDLNSANYVNGNCQVNINITFDISNNNGNKYIFIHLWKSSDYNFVNYSYSKGPKLSDIDGANHTHGPVATIAIDNSGTGAYLSTYSSDPTHIIPVVGSSLTKTNITNGYHFVLSGLSFNVPGACNGMVLQGDVWSTQSNASQPSVHCVSKGILFYGDPTINGQITCTNPHQFQVLLNTVSSTNITTDYKVYLDYPPVGTLNLVGPPGGADTLIYTSTSFILNASTPYNSGLISYLPYSNRKPSADQPILVQVNSSSGSFNKTTYQNIFNSCIPLPVTFNSFVAQRNNVSSVKLIWQTSSEVNNSGFNVERNLGGNWEQVAFVPSQASGGNSSSLLTYTYTDQNSTKGISQYRIRQVDINGKSTYSEIRAVRGIDQPGKTIVYPNPSFDGKVNVVFEDATGIRDISLVDMNGRVVKQWNGVSNNNLQIDNLVPGFYSLRVIVRETGAQSVEKIVINKR
jgi:hypothetical protein